MGFFIRGLPQSVKEADVVDFFNARNTDIMLLKNDSTHLARAKKFPASVGKKEISHWERQETPNSDQF